MASFNKEDGQVAIIILLVIALCFSMYYWGHIHGERFNQQAIEDRVMEIDSHCYSELDLEYIIFGEHQQ